MPKIQCPNCATAILAADAPTMRRYAAKIRAADGKVAICSNHRVMGDDSDPSDPNAFYAGSGDPGMTGGAAPSTPAPLAPVSQGPSQQQLEAMAMLQAFGGASGQAVASALAPSMAPQGTLVPVTSAPPDGTPCAMPDGSAGVYSGGQCSTVSATSSGESF